MARRIMGRLQAFLIATSTGGAAAACCRPMGRTLKTLLVGAFLMTSQSSAGGSDSLVISLNKLDEDTSLMLQLDPFYVAFTKMGTAVAIILGGCLLFRELTLGILDKLATQDEEEEEEEEEDDEEEEDNERDKEKENEGYDQEQVYSSYTHYDRKDTYYNRPNYHDYYYNHPSNYRSLVDNECFLAQVFYSIDLLEPAFAILGEEELACRKRTICELEKAASFRIPIIGSFLQYVSRCIRGLEVYKEALEAGAGLEDCALLFSECSNTDVQAIEPPQIPVRQI